ncbi:ATP-binding protein [Polyangium fumosum]|uniref:Histidine kinase n=1 Tax=Polyangium fumosum TaxID=889272 RepID=A0A4U1IER0_9BACT|nr:ATP-binding protein [Polyangium fumosum]TKC92127.1 histidine kinase [Polyangium fumosum]
MSDARFRTRARTIDHLGRNQIADCPTAISELWKNAYDAYARDVALHIFEGKDNPTRHMAAIVDNGHGMSRTEFVDRWLTVGTESKVGSARTPEADRLGLPERPKQGEKGIGRLSVAYLGPLVLVISKRKGQPFVASLIDWRVFENPYLVLDDVIVPIETFEDKNQLFAAFERMRTLLSENVWPAHAGSARGDRVRSAWERYDAALVEAGKPKLSDEIASTILAFEELTGQRLRCWAPWAGTSECGTALFVFDIRRELAVWVDPTVTKEDAEVSASTKLLEETLINFVDPYRGDERKDFRYELVVHAGGTETHKLRWDDTIPIEEIRGLEHVVEGEVDEFGVFTGNIRAFGKNLGTVVLPPPRKYNADRDSAAYVGPFKILIATFEVNAFNSSLVPEQHALWTERQDLYAGFAIYRDSLRVLPYGRQAGDIFEIDYRRSKNAGRYFWAYRRTFGRVALTREGNPNLVDKAGREGLRDNQARREFKICVMGLLKTTAQRYFGFDAPDRADIIRQNEEAYRAALKAAGTRSRKQFRDDLRKNEPLLESGLNDLRSTLEAVRVAVATDPAALNKFEEKVNALKRRKNDLAIGQPPRSMDEEDEQRYRAYRDRLREYREGADYVMECWAEGVARVRDTDPMAVATKRRDELQGELSRSLHEWHKATQAIIDEEQARVLATFRADSKRFPDVTSNLLVDLSHGRIPLATVLSRLEAERETLHQEFAARHTAYFRSLKRLQEGVDIEGTLRWSSDEFDELKERLTQLHSLAQLGVTVEIVGHEFESLDAEVRRGLSRLPKEAQATDAFQLIKHSHLSLMQKLRFLTPLKLSGPRLRETIRGKEISKYMRAFFADRLEGGRVQLLVTEAFDRIVITDFRSRLYPVFINLINNALYWVTFAKNERCIRLDCAGDAVVVSDSGEGVDRDDIPRLFELFFTRRVDGRGVGLYLCKENLGAGGHTIEYGSEKQYRLLSGANFIIRFRGIEHA